MIEGLFCGLNGIKMDGLRRIEKGLRICALVCAFCAIASIRSEAQDQGPQEPRNSISLDLFGTVRYINYYTNGGRFVFPLLIDYQHVLIDHLTLEALPALLLWENSFTFQPWIELDWHPFDKGLKGFFLGLAAVEEIDHDSDSSVTTSTHFGFAFRIGYQFLFANQINLYFAGVVSPNFKALSGESSAGLATLRVGLGYSF
jgi:hypothetical protein